MSKLQFYDSTLPLSASSSISVHPYFKFLKFYSHTYELLLLIPQINFIKVQRQQIFRYILYQIKLGDKKSCLHSCYKDKEWRDLVHNNKIQKYMCQLCVCLYNIHTANIQLLKLPEECNVCLFFVYIFAIYFIYIDKRDCEIFSHTEYVTRPEHVQEDILEIINSTQKLWTL